MTGSHRKLRHDGSTQRDPTTTFKKSGQSDFGDRKIKVNYLLTDQWINK